MNGIQVSDKNTFRDKTQRKLWKLFCTNPEKCPNSLQTAKTSASYPPCFSWSWRQLYKNRSSRKIDSKRPLSREYDFPVTYSLTKNQFSRKTYSSLSALLGGLDERRLGDEHARGQRQEGAPPAAVTSVHS